LTDAVRAEILTQRGAEQAQFRDLPVAAEPLQPLVRVRNFFARAWGTASSRHHNQARHPEILVQGGRKSDHTNTNADRGIETRIGAS